MKVILNKKIWFILLVFLLVVGFFTTPINHLLTSFVTKERVSFNLNINIPKEYKEISDDQRLLTTISVMNLKNTGRIDVLLNYRITKEENLVLEKSETVAFETQTGFVRYFDLPSGLESGIYKAEVVLEYMGEEVVSTDYFKVIKQEEAPNRTNLEIIFPLIALILVLVFIILKNNLKT